MKHSLRIHVARCFVHQDGRPELLHFMIARITQDAMVVYFQIGDRSLQIHRLFY